MKLRELIRSLSSDLGNKTRRPDFGLRVAELRERLADARRYGFVTQPKLFEEARFLMTALDDHYFRKISARIKLELDLETRSPGFPQDVARLQRFIGAAQRVWKPDESPALKGARMLLSELRERGVNIAIFKPAKINQPYKKNKGTEPTHVHHPTLDDERDCEPRILLIFGGAFEMNRRRH